MNHDVQASPGVLKLVGWDVLFKVAESLAPDWGEWIRHSAIKKRGKDLVKVLMWEYNNIVIEVIGYIDDNDIKVISFDPARKVHEIEEGHTRISHRDV